MHDQSIDGASGVMERKGRKRSVALLLLAAVSFATVIAGVANPAGAVPPAANPPLVFLPVAAGPNALKVSWVIPNPTDNVTGYVITTNPVFPTTPEMTPPKLSVTGLNTLTATVTNLACGGTYTFTVQSVGTAGENIVPAQTSPVATAPCVVVPPNPGPYVFSTYDATIKRHFEEFLQRDPNYSELIFWRTYFFNTASEVGGCGSTHPLQNSVDPAKTNTVGPFCPNTGPEFNLIAWLLYGDTTAFDSGGYAGPTDTGRNTYAGLAEAPARLYQAFFHRTPDFGGLKFWYKKYQGGRSLDNIADFFSHSHEFITQYGKLTDADFVTLVYNNVLARVPDFGGQNYWRGQLEAGHSRGFVMTRFSESNEYKGMVNYNIKTVVLYAALLGITPSQAQLDATVAAMNTTWDAYCFNTFRNESVAIVSSGGATSFQLTFAGQTTAVIPVAATPLQVQTALENLSNINVGDVAVTGAAGAWTVTFTGQYTNTNVADLTVGSITGTIPGNVVASITQGGATGSVQFHFGMVQASPTTPGAVDLFQGTNTSQSTIPCAGTTYGGTWTSIGDNSLAPMFPKGYVQFGYRVNPIQQLISTIRNSPAYTAVATANKPAALI